MRVCAQTKRSLLLCGLLREWVESLAQELMASLSHIGSCPFIRGLYDFNLGQDDEEIVRVIQAHFAALQNLVVELVRAARPRDHGRIAPLFMSLLSGSIVVAQVSRAPDIARISRAQADMLLTSKAKRSGAISANDP
jgi:hypothetical protein